MYWDRYDTWLDWRDSYVYKCMYVSKYRTPIEYNDLQAWENLSVRMYVSAIGSSSFCDFISYLLFEEDLLPAMQHVSYLVLLFSIIATCNRYYIRDAL